MRTICVGHWGVTTEAEVTVKQDGRLVELVTIGQLLDCWAKHGGQSIVGSKVDEVTKSLCKKYQIRQKDHL